MTLTFKHFDTRLNQWIHTDGTKNPESILTEKIEDTLLESFFPDKEFSFGQMDEYSTPEDLKNHPDGHVLLLSSKTRLLYGPPECQEVIDKLCPDRKDRGAYGSIFLGGCKNTINQQLNILIVDDTTGENGGILPEDVAFKLVGDCYGQVSTELYDQLTKREEQKDKSYRVVQHRFGWRSLDGEDAQYRFGKGTLRPYNLDEIKRVDPSNKTKIDLIVPISSFKGTDKDNPSGPIKPQIKPGLYTQTVWLGEKSLSQKGTTAISQLIPSFPQGMKDFAEDLEKQAQRLAEIQDDPRKVAQLYCEKYEKRKAFTEEQKASLQQEITYQSADGVLVESIIDSSLDEELATNDELNEEDESDKKDDSLMYKIIKADLLGGHSQVLETEKVKQELSRFVQKEWRDIATGKALTFERGLIIPSKDLKEGEICVPWMNPNEKILNFRSPFLNSNGLCVSVNKYIKDCQGPDGENLEGIIVVNDEDHKRIQARIDALKAQGIETDEINPAETESERQARDFDGDCIGVELARKYPNFTAEAERRNLPENAYAPTVKLKKQSFYTEDKQPPFEDIAIHMSDGMSVGVINNHVTALEALESEIEVLKVYGTKEQQSEYVQQVSTHYRKLLAKESDERYPKPVRSEYREQMKEFVALSKERTPEATKGALDINRSIYRKMIEEACYQNQIAVDLFKSAKTPDMDLIKENKRYLYRDVNYIKDKKSASAYFEEGITPKGYSPVELLINQTNKYFQESHLESRPINQFENLFNSVEFTPQQKFSAILAKQEFDTKFAAATLLKRRQETEKGPYAIIKTPQGEIEITNLTRYGHPGIWKAYKSSRGSREAGGAGGEEESREAGGERSNSPLTLSSPASPASPASSVQINIRLEEIPQTARSRERPHKLLAIAAIDGETDENGPVYHKLGTVSQQSAMKHKLEAGMATAGVTLVEIKPQISKNQVELLFQQAYEGAETFYASIPESQRLSAAAAAWDVSTTRKDEGKMLNNSSEVRESGDKRHSEVQKTVSNFIFAAFPNEIVSRLDNLQFTDIKLTGIGLEGDSFKEKVWNPDEKYPVEVKASHRPEGDERNGARLMFVQDSDGEYKEFGILEQRTGRLPIGTKALANITPGEAYTAKATLASPGKPPVEFTIREISKFSHAGQNFNGEQVTLSIGNVPIPDQTVKIKLDGKTLGELDADSIEQLKELNYLRNGNPLNLKFTPIGGGKEEGAFLIGESPNGNLLRINKNGFYDFKGQMFNDKDYRTVTIETPPTKNRDAVFLNGELLGVLHFKQDKEALKQLGFLKAGQMIPAPCTIQSNFSHSFVKVDPTTVQYPEVWTKESQAFKDTTKQLEITSLEMMVEKTEPLLQKIKERPTILKASQEDKEKGQMGIAVDKSKVETVTKWLTNQNIEFKQVAPQGIEERKGLAVFSLVSNSIPPQTLGTMLEKFGKVLDSTTSRSEYYQRINSLHDTVLTASEKQVAEQPTEEVGGRELLAGGANSSSLPALIPLPPASSQVDLVVSGKSIPMNFPLKMHGETNSLPVDTCIDAMRGYGRTHTTRAYEPYKQYDFKEGDIAIATNGSKQVAFRVGKQYPITQEMIADPVYQQQWALSEKHSPVELSNFREKQHVWGLHMEPLGDYVEGKVVPFPELLTKIQLANTKAEVAPPVNIGFQSVDALGASLANPTVQAKDLGNIRGDYSVAFRDNPAVPAGEYGAETYHQDKPEGIPFVSAEQAYQHYKETVPSGEPRVQLMAEIISAKLEQHPKLFQAIQQRGGVEWLENCTHQVTSNRDSYWEGKGTDSPFVRALIDGYSKVLEKSQTLQSSNLPAEVGKGQEVGSRVQRVEESRGAEEQRSREANSSFSTAPQPPSTSASSIPASPASTLPTPIADTAGNSEQSTVDNLRNWYSAANKLGKPEEYKNRIVQVATEFKSGHALSEKALTAMDRDMKELHSINRLTQIAQRVCDAMGQPGEGGCTQVSGKIYDVSFNLSSKHLTVSQKDEGVILDIKEGKIETNKVSPDMIRNFEDTNAKLDAILSRKKAECREM